MPPWWTDADDADARSHQTPETTHLTLQPPEPDAPPEAWEPFTAGAVGRVRSGRVPTAASGDAEISIWNGSTRPQPRKTATASSFIHVTEQGRNSSPLPMTLHTQSCTCYTLSNGFDDL